ncbi:terminase small subunit [Rheinheimera sp. MM224]|uniref:terminase small subunit n=1 Tax=Rheinheimera sp. MM224 TaxID=3019969 RepID=UPI0021F8CCF2|nr:terminase small subunit [Rheinheimera sp. MM224]CAI3795823.1 hypothetical protein JAMGFMIE_01414 [Rheinheimera sp. MM224]CAI3795984.1 hypothetical protein JAMGFMIE_01454 [Rheinheimera sp. MM224]
MALTDKKRKFADAILSGKFDSNHKGAAILAGYSEKTAVSAASRLMKDPDVLAHISRKKIVEAAKQQAVESGIPLNLPDLSRMFSDPKDFLKAVMNDPGEHISMRVDAAKTLMPYVHGKVADKGVKASKDDAAKKAVSRFSPVRPPLKVVK